MLSEMCGVMGIFQESIYTLQYYISIIFYDWLVGIFIIVAEEMAFAYSVKGEYNVQDR